MNLLALLLDGSTFIIHYPLFLIGHDINFSIVMTLLDAPLRGIKKLQPRYLLMKQTFLRCRGSSSQGTAGRGSGSPLRHSRGSSSCFHAHASVPPPALTAAVPAAAVTSTTTAAAAAVLAALPPAHGLPEPFVRALPKLGESGKMPFRASSRRT